MAWSWADGASGPGWQAQGVVAPAPGQIGVRRGFLAHPAGHSTGAPRFGLSSAVSQSRVLTGSGLSTTLTMSRWTESLTASLQKPEFSHSNVARSTKLATVSKGGWHDGIGVRSMTATLP